MANVKDFIIKNGLQVDGGTFIVDDTNNRVGIGTTSPDNAKLEIASGTNQIQLNTGDETTYGRLDIGHFTNGTFIGTYAGTNTAANLLRFGISGSTKVTLDANGLKIDTTDATPYNNTSGEGVVIKDGLIAAARSGASVLAANRMTSEGPIINLNYAGSNVGNIGVVSTNNVYINGDNVGIGIGDDNLYPTDNAGASTSGALDLGDSTAKFRHLYLSGNITVDGTVDGRDLATDGTKLDNIEAGATGDQTASEILTAIKTVDGSTSGLDADLLDGVHGSSFLRSDASDTMSQMLTLSYNGTALLFGGGSENGASYTPTESGSGQTRYFLRFDLTNNASYPYLTNRTPSGDVVIKTGSAAGGSENEIIRFNGGDGTRDIVITNGTLKNGTNLYWHAGNDGSGSGLDADTVDGTQLSRIIYGDDSYGANSSSTFAYNIPRMGFFNINNSSSENPSGGSSYWQGIELRHENSSNYWGWQLAGTYNTSDTSLYHRQQTAGTRSSWYKIWDENNDGASSGLDADLLDGQHGSYYTGYTDTAIANLVDTAPSTLDTLNELAAALGDDPNFSTTITTSIATKLPLAGGTMTGSIALGDNNLTGIGKLNFNNHEGSDYGSTGDVMFDENFYADTEYGSTSIWSGGNGGGLAVYNEDGWGRIITDRNMPWLTAQFDKLAIGKSAPSSTADFHVRKALPSGTLHYDGYTTAIIEDTEARLQIMSTDGGTNASTLLLSNGVKHWGLHHHGPTGSNVFSIGYRTSAATSEDIPNNLSDTFNISTGGNVSIGTSSFSHRLRVHSGADAQLALTSPDTWAGIYWDDANGAGDYIWFHGGTSTFAIGGGGSNVSGKKLHVDGGMTIGSTSDAVSMPTDGLYVQGNITANANLQVSGTGSFSGKLTLSGGDDDQATPNPALEITSGTIYIPHDESLIIFDEGQKAISSNDGQGNFNIYIGKDDDAVHVSSSSGNSGIAHIQLDGDGQNGKVNIGVGPQRASGSTANFDYGLRIESGASGLKWCSGTSTAPSGLSTEYTIWHSGNDGRFLRSDADDSASGSISFTNSYYEFGNSTGSVSNDGSWNARVNIAGSGHARLDVKSVSDGIITTMYSHTGQGVGRVGTYSNHPLALMTNGSIGATLNTSGNFGIGATSPFSKLQVGSNTFSGSNGVYADSRVGISNHGNLTSIVNASTYNDSTYPDYGLVFIQGPSTSSYNVWSISPDGPAKGDSLNFIYGSNATNIHTGTPKVVFDGNGNVGIGATSPFSTLTVNGTQRIEIDSNVSGAFSSNAAMQRDGAIIFPVTASKTTQTSDDGGGWASIGWATTSRSGEQMHRNTLTRYANSGSGTAMGFYIEAGTGEAGGICLDEDSVNVYGSSDQGTTFRVIDKDSDVVTFEMLQTSWNGVFRGDVIAYGSLSSISDIRIKENIKPYVSVLDRIMKLGVYSYNKITAPKDKRDKVEIGVIAQEVEEVFPELVNEEKVDKPEDANGLETIKTVDYEHMTAILLQAIKEQQAQIESQQEQINELKALLEK